MHEQLVTLLYSCNRPGNFPHCIEYGKSAAIVMFIDLSKLFISSLKVSFMMIGLKKSFMV
jgi:hypothetical protein